MDAPDGGPIERLLKALSQVLTLDVARVRATLKLLEEILTQSDLSPAFERLWSAART